MALQYVKKAWWALLYSYTYIISFTSSNIEYRIVLKNKVLPLNAFEYALIAWSFAQIETFHFFGVLQHGKLEIGLLSIIQKIINGLIRDA